MKKPLDPVQTKRAGSHHIEQVGLGITSADAANVRLTHSRVVDTKVLRCITIAAERALIRQRPMSTHDYKALQFIRELQHDYPELLPRKGELTDGQA